MKRLMLIACSAALLPALALAQIQANPKAKVDPKNNKVSRPVVEKVKPKLLTRDELRACMKQQADNTAEAEALKAEQPRHAQERSELLALKESMAKRGEAISARASELKAEREALLQLNAALSAELPKLDKAVAQERIKDYQARAAAHDAKIDAFNTEKTQYASEAKVFDSKVEAHNTSSAALKERGEKHLDAIDAWKEACANKPYDEADEIAIKKELGAN